MDKRNIVKRRKIARKGLFWSFSLLIGVLVFVTMLQGSDDPEVRFQNKLLENRSHKIDENCFFFDAFDKELFCLLKLFKKQHPELQIEGVFRSGNGSFVTFSCKEKE